MKTLALVSSILVFLPGTALAADVAEPTTGEDMGFRFAHGGVGKDGRKAIKKVAPNYEVELLFIDDDEKYLANVEVRVKRKGADKALSVLTDGPMLLLDVPDGRYQVTANLPGRKKVEQSFTSRGEDRTKIIMRLER